MDYKRGEGENSMAGYICKRVVAALLTILLVATITFLVMNTIPGSPFLD